MTPGLPAFCSDLLILGMAALLVPAAAAARPIDRWTGHIGEASSRFAMPEEWIRRVIEAESGGRTVSGGRPIVSSAGAMGLMQLMPGTWEEMRRQHGLGTDPHDPRDNILAGTAYLRLMYDRFGYPGLFAAYNAGPKRYSVHLKSGRELPSETIAYISKLSGRGSLQAASAAARQLPASSGLFALRRGAPGPVPATSQLPSAVLFAVGGQASGR